jgi:hypothetical protein
MEQNSIIIHIAGQDVGNMKKIYLVIGILGILYILLSFLFLNDIGLHNYLMWLVFLPGFVQAILYGSGKRRLFSNITPYLKIDQHKIENSSGGIFATPQTYMWDAIRNIDIKLFEIVLTTHKGEIHTISLNTLTDENLKRVKEFLIDIKKTKESIM